MLSLYCSAKVDLSHHSCGIKLRCHFIKQNQVMMLSPNGCRYLLAYSHTTEVEICWPTDYAHANFQETSRPYSFYLTTWPDYASACGKGFRSLTTRMRRLNRKY